MPIRGPALKPGAQALAALPWFSRLGPGRLALVNEAADLARLGPGEALFRDGDNLAEVNFLVAGQVGATHSAASAEQGFVDVLLPVRALCLPAAWLGLPAPVGMRTLTTTRLIVVPVKTMREALTPDASAIEPALDCAMREAHEQALDLVRLKTRSSPQRLAAYLVDLIGDSQDTPARFVLPVEKRLLAAHIGCSQENLSRAFAMLRRVGVQTQGAVVIVRDVAALRGLARSRRAS